MANNYLNFDKTSYTIPNNVYGFEIKYQSVGFLPNQITVIHESGDFVMTNYKVYADYIFISVNTNDVSEQKTEIINVKAGADFSQIININQKEKAGGIGFSVSVQDDISVVTLNKQFDVNIKVTRILLEDIPNYSVRYEASSNVQFVREAFTPGTLNGIYTFKASSSAQTGDDLNITVYLEKYMGSGQKEIIMKKDVSLKYSRSNFYLSQDYLNFDYAGNPIDKNYVQVLGADPITSITIYYPQGLTYSVVDNYIYISKLNLQTTYPIKATIDVNGVTSLYLTLNKEEKQNVYSYPIWKDIFIDLPNNINYFRIVNIDSGFIIYEGMIYGFITTKIGISDIVRDYMTTVTDPFINIYTTTSFLNIDVLISEDKSTWKQFYTFNLYYNYSYNDEIKFYLEAQPIDYYDPRQYLLFTAQDINNGLYSLSVSEYYIIPKGNQQTISIPANNKDRYVVRHSGGQTTEYVSKCTNTNYAVYYLNRYGGWSWMLFNGKNIKTDKTTHNIYSVSFDNNIGTDYQSKIYQNDIQESWTLTTDYLTDKQSELLKHLYSSPLVYLHDLEADKVISVLIDTKSFDYKTYKNQGKKFFTHTIKVNSSQTKIIL